MSSPPRRRPFPTPTASSTRRGPSDISPNRPMSSTSMPTSTGQGLARNPSIRQSRALRKPNRTSSSFGATDLELEQDEEARNSNAQLIADLQDQVQRAEQASEQYRKHLEIMQKRLEDSTNEQTVAEERDYQRQTELDHLRAEIKDSGRLRREIELTHGSEKRMLLQDRERQANKEAELQGVIGRLNEALRAKGLERSNNIRTASMPVSQDQYEEPRNPHTDEYRHAMQEKDNTIEDLRLELAEFHLKAAEDEHMGDGQVRHLERVLMETKMQNARLLEENESFTMLLSEKTLKGDFLHDHQPMDSSGLNTLAEELESADPDTQNEGYKKLEAELKAAKESNKALTLYIDKIIGRLLQHDGFEHIILDKDAPPDPPTKPIAAHPTMEKALPAPPGAVQNPMTPTQASVSSAAAGFLQRARSVVARPSTKPRPMSYMPPSSNTANENPETAPSIPLNRGHRRARSDQDKQDLGAAAVVQQMNRGSPLRAVSGGGLSPGISPLSPQLNPSRASYFPASTRASDSAQGERGSSRNSVASGDSLERESTDASSGPNSAQGPIPGPNTNIPGAVMKQNQLRPLRLVQEQSREDEEAQKRANRGSWMGWFKGSSVEASQHEERL